MRFPRDTKALLATLILFASAPITHCLPLPTIDLVWDPSPSEVTGYNLYIGTETGHYLGHISVGNQTSVSVLVNHPRMVFVVTALCAAGESEPTNEVCITLRSAASLSISRPFFAAE